MRDRNDHAETIWCQFVESPGPNLSFSPFGSTTVSRDSGQFVGREADRNERRSPPATEDAWVWTMGGAIDQENLGHGAGPLR